MLWVSNLADGIDQYRFPSLERVRNFHYTVINNHPMQIALCAQLVVVGGDDGFARLFDVTNHGMEKLIHGAGKCTSKGYL